jgi:hypothetical protein
MTHEQRDVALRTVFDQILDADLLLFRDRGFCAGVIAAFGRSQYTHVGLAARWYNGARAEFDLMSLELKCAGGRAALLASQVHRYPGQIDVFSCRRLSLDQRHAIARTMRRQCGIDYSYAGILRLLLLRVPLLRMLPVLQAVTSDGEGDAAEQAKLLPYKSGDETWTPKFCSQAVAYSFGLPYGRPQDAVDLVPELADAATEPADLARSALVRYQYTLWP